MANPFDSNVWYHLTEYRVNWTSSFQTAGGGVLFAALGEKPSNMFWQLFPLSDNTYQIRNKASGTTTQLSACYDKLELPSNTRACMKKSDLTDAQRWRVIPWGDGKDLDGSFYLENVSNGTGYRLDVHPGNPVFMNSDVSGDVEAPAQHWIFSSLANINDGGFSKTLSLAPSATTSAATTSAAPSQSTTSSPQTTSDGMAGSLKIALGIGLGLGVMILILLAVLFFLYRKKKAAKARYQAQSQHASPYPPAYHHHELYTHESCQEIAPPKQRFEMHAPQNPQEIDGYPLPYSANVTSYTPISRNDDWTRNR